MSVSAPTQFSFAYLPLDSPIKLFTPADDSPTSAFDDSPASAFDADGSTDPADTLADEPVMKPSCQDPLMTASYAGLPHIAVFADVSPHGYDLKLGGYVTKRAQLTNVAKTMCKKDFECVSILSPVALV